MDEMNRKNQFMELFPHFSMGLSHLIIHNTAGLVIAFNPLSGNFVASPIS